MHHFIYLLQQAYEIDIRYPHFASEEIKRIRASKCPRDSDYHMSSGRGRMRVSGERMRGED